MKGTSSGWTVIWSITVAIKGHWGCLGPWESLHQGWFIILRSVIGFEESVKLCESSVYTCIFIGNLPWILKGFMLWPEKIKNYFFKIKNWVLNRAQRRISKDSILWEPVLVKIRVTVALLCGTCCCEFGLKFPDVGRPCQRTMCTCTNGVFLGNIGCICSKHSMTLWAGRLSWTSWVLTGTGLISNRESVAGDSWPPICCSSAWKVRNFSESSIAWSHTNLVPNPVPTIYSLHDLEQSLSQASVSSSAKGTQYPTVMKSK